MKMFLKNIGLFFLPILLLSWPIDLFFSKVLAKNDSVNFGAGEYAVWNDIFAGQANAELAIYGNSRAWTQIDPVILADSLNHSAYNFGVDGHNFAIQLLRHRLYQKYNKKPELIIISVDFTTFQKQSELYNYYQFLPYMLWDSAIEKYTADYIGFTKFDYKIPLIRYAGELDLLKDLYKFGNKDNFTTRDRGFKAHQIAWNSDYDKALAKLKKLNAVLDEKLILLFQEFLLECQAKDIKLLMVHTPIHVVGQDFIENHEEVVASISNLAKSHEVAFLDYTKDELCFDKTYFYNSMHMNEKGVELFTVKLLNDIKKLGIL